MKEKEWQKLSKKDLLAITTIVVLGTLVVAGINKIESSLLEELIAKNPEAFYAFMNLVKR